MRFPLAMARWRVAVFVGLLAVAAAEISVAQASWNIVYRVLTRQLDFLSSYLAATQQFAHWGYIVAALAMIWIYRPDLRRTFVAFVVALALANLATTTIKEVAGRARPPYGVMMENEEAAEIRGYLLEHDNPVLKPVRGDYWLWFSEDRPGLEPFRVLTGEFGARKLQPFGQYDSFPSGHATGAFVFATFLALLFPRSRVVWYLLAAGCAIARIRFRRHLPGDVIVGSAIGWFTVYWVFSWAWPFRLGEKLLGMGGAPEPKGEPHASEEARTSKGRLAHLAS